MKKSLTLLSVVAVLMLSGCGSSSSDSDNQVDVESQMVNELVVPEAHKVERANWDGVAPIVENFFITDDERLLSFKIKDRNIADGNYATEAIYIDADNNSNTGFSREWMGNIGAEYRIEGNNLFRHVGNGWNWEFVSRVNRNIQGDEIEVEFLKTSLNLSRTINVTAILINNNWRAIKRTDIATYNPSNDNNNGGTSIEINELNADTDMGSRSILEFTIKSANINRDDFRSASIYIDADNNVNTGYNRPWLNGIGADYRIEGNRVFKHNGNGWNWSLITASSTTETSEPIASYEKTDSTIEVSINRATVPLSSSIKVASFLLDNNYRAIESFEVSDTISLNMEAQLKSISGNNFFVAEAISLEENGNIAFVEYRYWDDPSTRFLTFIDNYRPLEPKFVNIARVNIHSRIVWRYDNGTLFYDIMSDGNVERSGEWSLTDYLFHKEGGI